MTDTAPLRLVDDPEAADGDGGDPKVFARSISVPPGAPWDQASAARLEARAGAPLPLGELSYQVRRLEGWRPGNHARFAAFYVRTSEIGARLTSLVEVDGRNLEVTFVSRSERDRQTRGASSLIAAAAGAFLIIIASIAVAISARQGAEAQLQSLEQLASAKTRVAIAADAQRREASQLDVAGARERSLAGYLSDLDWLSGARAPGARIQAVHWQNGAMVIEARGDAAPLVASDRQVSKLDKPLQAGVWLWGIERAHSRVSPAPNP